MTNDELNKQAHEALGYRLNCNGCEACMYEGDESCLTPVPDYCSSLDAASELERFTIEKVGQDNYLDHLSAVIESDPRGPYSTLLLCAIATAEQRVKACLAALSNGEKV